MRLVTRVALRNPPPTSDRAFPHHRGTDGTWDATCCGAVARASAASRRGAPREAGLRMTAIVLRTIAPENRAAKAASDVYGPTAPRLGTRASLFSRSQRAVDVRASAITRAIAATNPTAINVTDTTTTHPRYGRKRSGSRSSAAVS